MEHIFDYNQGHIFVIDKPLEWSSTDVVRKVKFALSRSGFRKIKVGHAGTLDPLATGILLVCAGRAATKRISELQAGQKEYVTDIMLGATTPSHDLEHPIDATYPTEHITREMFEQALHELSGEREQIPPVYSAKRIDGKRAYEYARKGVEDTVEMKGSVITIYNMEILEWDMPRVRIRVECSKGTYIRSLAHEIGVALNSGAHLTSLRRTRSGEFTEQDAKSVEQVLQGIFDNVKK